MRITTTFLKILILTGTAMVFSALVANRADAENVDRQITADWNQIQGPTTQLFHECIGAGRANEGLRADWQRQLQLCQDEIGFKQIRFHGLLSDDMGVYSETAGGQPRHNWQYIDALYDALLAVKIRPFVELSFMPSALAGGTKKMFWWQANVTPPKSYEKWDGLIHDLLAHWTERYGADEVAKWNFEVWNEPNYPGFWGPRDPQHAREEYFQLYAHTANAVKSVIQTTWSAARPAPARIGSSPFSLSAPPAMCRSISSATTVTASAAAPADWMPTEIPFCI